jgi:hypothetical protein
MKRRLNVAASFPGECSGTPKGNGPAGMDRALQAANPRYYFNRYYFKERM